MNNEITLKDLPYTGPQTIAGKYLRKFWHPVYQSSKLAAKTAVTITLMNEEWTLYRGEGGTPYIVGSRCAHRNVKLSVGWVEGEEIRCFYHGWKYDGSGRCTEQPAEPDPFFAKVRIQNAVAREYLGWIFVWVGYGAPPPLPAYDDFDKLTTSQLLCSESLHNVNYFNSIDNVLDATHVGFVHSNHAGGFDGRHDSPVLEVSETCWGAMSKHSRPSGKVGQTQFGMPNVMRLRAFPAKQGLGPRDILFWIVPVDDTHFRTCFVEAIRLPDNEIAAYRAERAAIEAARVGDIGALAEAVVDGRIRREDVDQSSVRYPQFVDDVVQLAQGRIHDRSFERLGASDIGMKLVRQIWLRELRAADANTELTNWRYDANLPMSQSDE